MNIENVLASTPAKGPFQKLARFVRRKLAAWIFKDVPLIWTKYGNMPEADLDMTYRWDVQPGKHISYTVTHKLNGEVVKEAPAVLILPPMPVQAEQGQLF